MPVRPLGASDGPFVLGAVDKVAVDGSHSQHHRGLAVPAVVDVFQEVVEKPFLQTDSVVGVELGPVLAAVDLQPFLARRRAQVAFHIASKVPACAAPVARRQKRHRDPVEHRRTFPVEIVVERMGSHVGAVVGSVGGELFIGQSLRAGDEFAGVGADEAALAQAVLNGRGGAPVPDVDGLAEHSTVVEHVAIEVADALPRHHCAEMRRVEARDQPLGDGVVADPEQADLAGTPRPGARPLSR